MHHALVRHVAVREHGLVHVELGDDLLELGLGADRDPVGIEVSRQRRRITPAGDVGDLRGRERHDFDLRVGSKAYVEVVKIAAGRTEDDDASPRHGARPCGRARSGAGGNPCAPGGSRPRERIVTPQQLRVVHGSPIYRAYAREGGIGM
jgi:hypothetical protein